MVSSLYALLVLERACEAVPVVEAAVVARVAFTVGGAKLPASVLAPIVSPKQDHIAATLTARRVRRGKVRLVGGSVGSAKTRSTKACRHFLSLPCTGVAVSMPRK